MDGYDAVGERVYDRVNGKTCHQCRQKTIGKRTHCSHCESADVRPPTSKPEYHLAPPQMNLLMLATCMTASTHEGVLATDRRGHWVSSRFAAAES